MPGRSQPTVELDVPKSIPQARAADAFFMSFEFRLEKTAAQCMPVVRRIEGRLSAKS
jgi:hypothetical protein